MLHGSDIKYTPLKKKFRPKPIIILFNFICKVLSINEYVMIAHSFMQYSISLLQVHDSYFFLTL